MITTLYRRPDAPTSPAAVFDPDLDGVDPGSVDELRGAVPSWRPGDDPLFWELMRDGLAPVDVTAAAVEVVPWLLERLVDDPVPYAQSNGGGEPHDEHEPVVENVDNVGDVVDLPTRALQLVVDNVAPDVACPDCGASGHDPCRPKHRPTGAPLPRWHARRRRLADAGGSLLEVLIVVAVVAVLVAMLAGWLVSAFAPLEDRLRPCPVPTAASCPDGPGGAR